MARGQMNARTKMWVLWLIVTVYFDCVYCMESTTPNDGTTRTSLDDVTQANGLMNSTINDNLEQTGASISSITSEIPTSDTTGDRNTITPDPLTMESKDNIVTTMNVTMNPDVDYGEIQWILFTGWQMPLVMVCVEIFAYCVTIFIVFGFSQKRSRVKRFGHFSWKRPNPYREDMPSVSSGRDHYIADGGAMMETTFMGKKASIRGHRP